jgi:hypothetical protein
VKGWRAQTFNACCGAAPALVVHLIAIEYGIVIMHFQFSLTRTAFAASAALVISGVLATGASADTDSDWVGRSIQSSRAQAGGTTGNSDGGRSAGRTSPRTSAARMASPSRLGGPVGERPATPRPSLSGGITWQASAGCVPGQLQGVLSGLVSNFGQVRVTSTCRSQAANRAAGGASKSYHLSGEAIDFRVPGAGSGAVYAYLSNSGSVGGLKHYGGGLFHIDTGPRRPM